MISRTRTRLGPQYEAELQRRDALWRTLFTVAAREAARAFDVAADTALREDSRWAAHQLRRRAQRLRVEAQQAEEGLT